MEHKFSIVSDGSCDLGAEAAALGVTIVPFYICFPDEVHQQEGTQLSLAAFYERLVRYPGVFPCTSTPSVEDFCEAFRPAAAAGMPVLCVCISQKFSAAYQTALIARDLLLEESPDAEIVVLNSIVNTVLQGLLVREAVALRDAGADLHEAAARLEAIKGTGRIFFTVGGLDYLRHGGRIGHLAGMAGTVLNLRPIITLREGEIFSAGVARGRRQSREKVLMQMQKYIEQAKLPPERLRLIIGYGHSREEGVSFRHELMTKLQLPSGHLPLLAQIGAAIAVHTGPHALGAAVLFDTPALRKNA